MTLLARDLLHGYQNKGSEFICRKKFCALWALMGAGKTVTTLTAIVDLIYDLEVRHVLLVAPLRVCVSTWPKEIKSWAHTHHISFAVACGSDADRRAAIAKRAEITIINRENIDWLVQNYGQKQWLWDMVVLDESSSFKNHASNRWKALRRVRGKINRMVQLTGTPSPNGLHDIWAPVYLLDGGERLGANITAFRRRWFDHDFDGFGYTAKDHAAREIQDRIADLVMVIESYEGLPETVFNPVYVDMPDAVMQRYKAFVRESLLQLESGEITAMNAGILANKLLQFTGGFIYDDERNVHPVHTLKIEALREIADTATSPLLVAYNYQHELEALKKAFPKARMLDKLSSTIDQWNAGEIDMLLAHPASAGHGLNLQKGGCNLVWYSLPWSLELYQQFNARLARQGQVNTVFLHHILLRSTIDERVLSVLSEKASTQDSLIAAVKAAAEIATQS